MSKVLRTIAVVAGAVALVATGVGAFAGAAGIKGIASAATIEKIATVATVVGGVAGIGAQLTAPKPTARGSITQVILEAEPPRPYIMGETYFAGVMRHQVGYGATIDKVPSPYLWEVIVYSGVSVDALVAPQFDFGTISSYYDTFYAYDDQLGAVPESTALVPPYGTAPGWTSASKLSGNAAIGWNFKFDKDGKRYASGRPVTGAIWRGVRVYDPRQDSTFPGGSGACRLGDESTYVYLRNPACHAGTYAYGRYQLSKKVFGIGLTAEAIDFEAIAAWANDCDANEWYVDGVIFEGGSQGGPGIKARNLSDICVAGGGQWITSGGVLSFDWNRPRVSLDTITDADIMRAGGVDVIAVQPHRERFNTVRPQYTSPAHNWQLITAAPIVGSTYVAEDGESKTQTWPLSLVKGTAQAGELASYALVDSREIGPFTINLPAEWRFYRPGDTLTLNSAQLDYNGQIVIQRRTFNPATLVTTLVVRSETSAKHDFALGKVSTPPPTPVLGQTGEQRDELSSTVVIGETGPAGPAGPAGPTGPTGAPGPAGAPATSANLTNDSAQLFAYANGNVVSYAGATGEFKVFAGQADVSASFSLSTVANPQGLTIGYSGRTYTVTGGFDAGEDTATVTIRATGSGGYAGVVFDKVFSLSKAKGGYEIVGSLPTTDLFSGRVVFNEADDKLYRYTGTAWTASVPAIDIDGTIDYQQIGNGAVRVQHLLVTPNNINPDPLFRDEAFWIRESGGWFFEDAPGSSNAIALGYRKYATLWSGTYTGTARRHIWGNTFPFSGQGQNLRLRARCGNYSNQAMIVGIDFFDQIGGYLGGTYPSIPAGSGASTLNHLFTVPVDVASIRFTMANEAPGTAFSGNILVTDIKLDVASDASMIVDGAIVAGKIAANAVTADKIEAGAITAAKVAASNVITLSAQINDAVITNAKIANLAVDTIKIAGNAVTTAVSAYANDSVTMPAGSPSTNTVRTLTMNTTGGPVTLLMQVQVALDIGAPPFTGAGAAYLRILRNGSEIRLGSLSSIPDYIGTDISLFHLDTPPAGTHTYTFQVMWSSFSWSGYASNAFLFALETKR